MPFNPNMRVLVVDDFATMRRIVRNILRRRDQIRLSFFGLQFAFGGKTLISLLLRADLIDERVGFGLFALLLGERGLNGVGRSVLCFGHLKYLFVDGRRCDRVRRRFGGVRAINRDVCHMM